MAEPTLPYAITNGTTANASEVQANDQALLDGITDGTKDIEIAALTTTGNCIFGNSAVDIVTFNASLASTIPVSANSTYDFGTSTSGLRSVYIGGSSTFTCRILGGTQAASWTLTLPISAGTTGQFPVTDGTGVLAFRYPDKAIAVQTGTYAATGSETLIPVDGTSAFTVTLPAISSFPYKRYIIKRIDQTLANAVTIARSSSDTFTEATTGITSLTLNTQGEEVELINDGTSIWYVMRRIPSVWTAYTPTLVGFGTGGTPPTNVSFWWRRSGDSVQIRGTFTTGTPTATEARCPFPTGLTSSSTKIGSAIEVAAISGRNANTSTFFGDYVTMEQNVTYVTFSSQSSLGHNLTKQNGNQLAGSGETLTVGIVTVPISGWAG